MFRRVDVDRLPVDPDRTERMIGTIRVQPPLVAVSGIEGRRSGRFPHPGIAYYLRAAERAVVHRHHAEAGVVAQRRVEAAERADLRLILAFIEEGVALRADLLPQLLL